MDKNKITFNAWMKEWLEVYHRPTVRESTYAATYNRIHNHVLPEFDNVLLKDLRPDMLQKYFNKKAVSGRVDKYTDPKTSKKVTRDGGLEVQTLMHIKSNINQALNKAVKSGIVLQNVCKDVDLPELNQKDVEILTVDEQKRLEKVLLASKNPYAFPILFVLYSGLRIGELRALRTGDIDYDRREIYIQRSLGRVAIPDSEGVKTKLIVNEPKAAKGKRVIPMPD